MKRRAIAIGLIICMLLPFSVLLVFAKEPDVYFYDCFLISIRPMRTL